MSEERLKELEEQIEKFQVDLHSEKNTTDYYINKYSRCLSEYQELREEVEGLKEKLWLSEQGRSQAWDMYRAKEKEVRQLLEVIARGSSLPQRTMDETNSDSLPRTLESDQNLQEDQPEPTSSLSWPPLRRKSPLRRYDDV